MKNLLTLLLTLLIIGILWIGSRHWVFSENEYVNTEIMKKTQIYTDRIDLEFLKTEFRPAYEF